MITIQLEAEVEAILARVAAEAGQSPSDFVRDALLQQLEDAEDYRVAAAALEEFLASGEAAIPLEVIMREDGLAD